MTEQIVDSAVEQTFHVVDGPDLAKHSQQYTRAHVKHEECLSLQSFEFMLGDASWCVGHPIVSQLIPVARKVLALLI